MLKKIQFATTNFLLNVQAPKLKKRIVVIESDDWGSLRMPSVEVYTKLVQKGVRLASNPFNKFDSLEVEGDLTALYSVLRNHRDATNAHPVITTNFIVANPVFKEIEENGFTQFEYEPFYKTYQRREGEDQTLNAVLKGTEQRLIRPQFHGRDHIHALRWLRLLKQNHRETREAFQCGVFCMDVASKNSNEDNLMAALSYSTEEEARYAQQQVQEGLQLFEEIFGYRSQSLIAPRNVWGNEIEKTASEGGVKYLQSLYGQLVSQIGREALSISRHFCGERNQYNQLYFVRNAYFEPSTRMEYEWVKECLRKIDSAFSWKLPAIISTHRVNFMGTLVPENRERNLLLLDDLLKAIVKRWPDVEFMSTDELGVFYQE